MRVIYGLGRAILGGFFAYNGINHFQNTEALAGYAASKQVSDPERSVKIAGGVLLASGVSMFFGYKPRLGALGALGFLAAVSPIMHDYWNVEDPQQKQNDLIQFSKNVALIGAALAVIGAESASA